MQHEKLYRAGGNFLHYGQARYLRADLFLNISKLYVANRRLAQYGWRHHAWIEAKFLRGQTGRDGTESSSNKTIHVASLLADFIRLVTLVPEQGAESSAARYFLHVYDAHPDRYLTFRDRPWLKALTTAGRQKITVRDLDGEAKTVKKILGDLPGLSIVADLTNLSVIPIDSEHRPVYHCYLTRIDAFKCQLDQHEAELDTKRQVTGADNDALARIAAFVAENLHIQSGSREETPPAELDPPIEEAAPGAAEPEPAI